jgi:hypothetical protein
MIRRPRPTEIKLLPQIENDADRRRRSNPKKIFEEFPG